MVPQDYLLRMGPIICVAMSEGCIPKINAVMTQRTGRERKKAYKPIHSPIHPPCIQFMAIRSTVFVWHRIFNCGVVDVKGPISLKVL